MKKILIIISFITLCIPFTVNAKTKPFDKFEVQFNACVDGDTAKFVIEGEVKTARFLAIDTPETKHPTKGEEPYGKEASNYTCNALKNAKKIELQYDKNSDQSDKYNRLLVWVFVDDWLLQDQLIQEGLGEVAYLYGNYEYTPLLQDHQKIAQMEKIGKWSDKTSQNISYQTIGFSILIFIIMMILCLSNKKYRKKTIRKIKSKTKAKIKKELEKI